MPRLSKVGLREEKVQTFDEAIHRESLPILDRRNIGLVWLESTE